ncbi:MAG: hypothetical protein ACWGNV_07555 [Bacteroidales bacterium]
MQKLIPLTLLSLLSVSVTGQQLQEILENHYDAAAQEKMGKIESIITQGKNQYAAAGVSSSFTLYQERPMKIRVETEFRGSEVIQTFNGEKGYMYAPSMGINETREMDPNELQNLRSQVEFEDPLWNYTENGSRLEYLESEANASFFPLKMTTANEDVIYFFIDRESYLISSIRSTRRIGGRDTEITTVLEEYKSTRGIPVARKVLTRMNGETVTTVLIEKVEFNKKIDPALFEKPISGTTDAPGS